MTLSDGACTVDIFTCTIVGNVITIKVTQEIPANVPTEIVITGLDNPRNDKPTGPFVFVTFDSDGISEIDSGFNINTQMLDLAPITNFSVKPSNETNGGISDVTISITTQVKLEDGDVLSFTVPSQVIVPQTADELNIISIGRDIREDLLDVKDELKVEVNGNTITVTFVKVGEATNLYKFVVSGLKNPPSQMESDGFSNIYIKDKDNWSVMIYNILPPPTISN